MKKLLLGALLLLSINVFGQNNLKFIFEKDIMTDNEYILISKNLLCSEDNIKGFFIEPVFKRENNKIVYYSMFVKSAGIKGCNENDVLIFLFEDNTKIQINSWQKFNCDGKSYFDIKGIILPELNKKIKAIRLTNGRTYDSFTYECKTEFEKNYFIYINEILKNQ